MSCSSFSGPLASRARPPRRADIERPFRLRPRTLGRLAAGFAAGLALWFGFRVPYERPVGSTAQAVLRACERPPVTRLSAKDGEFLLDRADFPPDSPRPGLPADDIHFNVVLLVALFALQPRFFEGESLLRLLVACGLLFLTHVGALAFQVESVYATRLGDWSAVHYGAVARNFWAGGFHFYLVAGRFAVPFVLFWLLARRDAPPGGRRGGKRGSADR